MKRNKVVLVFHPAAYWFIAHYIQTLHPDRFVGRHWWWPSDNINVAFLQHTLKGQNYLKIWAKISSDLKRVAGAKNLKSTAFITEKLPVQTLQKHHS